MQLLDTLFVLANFMSSKEAEACLPEAQLIDTQLIDTQLIDTCHWDI